MRTCARARTPATAATFAALLALAATLALAGCDAAPADHDLFTVQDSAGVELVRNVLPPGDAPARDDVQDAGPPVTHTVLDGAPLLRLGSEEPGPELFGGIGLVRVDPVGRLWVLDQVAAELRVFALDDGAHHFTVGGRGEGPGEFQQPVPLGFDEHGAAWVWDNRLGRLTVVEPDGTLRETLRPGQDHELIPRLAARTPAGTFVGQVPQRYAGTVSDGMVLQDTVTLRELDASGRELRVMARRQGQTWYLRDGIQAPVPFAEGSRFAVWGSRVVLSDPGGEPTLDVVEDGRLVRRIGLELERERVTPALVEADLAGPTRADATADMLRNHVDELPIPDRRPAWGWIRLGPAGEIFALRHGTLLAGEVWDVFDADGRWRGTVTLVPERHLMEVGPGVLVVVEMEELRGPGVAVFPFELR